MPKGHGTCKLAEGHDVVGGNVTLIEDVITTNRCWSAPGQKPHLSSSVWRSIARKLPV